MNDPALSAHEHAEHAEHAAHANDPFISRVSITIAVLAVLAAAVGSLETLEAGAAIESSSEAVLEQNKASDIWGEYQADSLKKHLYGIAADAGGANAERYHKTSDEQQATQRSSVWPFFVAECAKRAFTKLTREAALIAVTKAVKSSAEVRIHQRWRAIRRQ